MVSKFMFFIAFLSFTFNMKMLFNMLVIFELFSFSILFCLFLSKSFFFLSGVVILVSSAIFGLILFFMVLMTFGQEMAVNMFFLSSSLSLKMKGLEPLDFCLKMTSPFWSFDPFILKYNFLLLLCLFFFMFPLYYLYFVSAAEKFFYFLKSIMKLLFPALDFFSSGAIFYLSGMFFFMSVINLLSLLSFIFSPLAHIMLTMVMSMTMWFSTILYQLFFYLKEKTIHLAPKGTPLWLLFFMVLIELISQLIRPITLGVRLAANLTAGHLILSLLSGMSLKMSFFLQLPLLLLEMLVALVQPFVFCLLVFLYFLES